MNFENLPNGTLVYCCKLCDSCFLNPDEVTIHINNDHTFASEDEASQSIVMLTVDNGGITSASCEVLHTQPPFEQKLWTKEATLLLIELVSEYEDKLENSVKKHIWMKIAKLINEKLNLHLTWLQCDTKWKSLNKTYKEIRCHNNSSGKNRKKWEYFEIMNKILHKRPEITPPATCSSNEGLKMNETITVGNGIPIQTPNLPLQPSTSTSKKIESTMAKKRKDHTSDVERRHREKMAKQDEFLKQFKELVAILKTSKGTTKNDVPENSDT